MSAAKTEHVERIADVRNSFADAIGRARYSNEPTVLTSRGKRVAALVSMDFYETGRTIERLLTEASEHSAGAHADDGADLTLTLPNGDTLLVEFKRYTLPRGD